MQKSFIGFKIESGKYLICLFCNYESKLSLFSINKATKRTIFFFKRIFFVLLGEIKLVISKYFIGNYFISYQSFNHQHAFSTA